MLLLVERAVPFVSLEKMAKDRDEDAWTRVGSSVVMLQISSVAGDLTCRCRRCDDMPSEVGIVLEDLEEHNLALENE